MGAFQLVNEHFNICTDCLQHASGVTEADRGKPYSTEHPPWSRVSGDLVWVQRDWEGSEEPFFSFSHSDCPACGDPLGGDRFEGRLFRQTP